MSVFHFIGLSSPYLLFFWLAGVIPPSPGVCSEGRSWSGAFSSSAVGGEWLDNHCHIAVLCCPQHGLETDWDKETTGIRGERGGESHGIRSVTQISVAAVATASSSKADGSVGSRLPMTQLALLTPAQVWMKPRLTPEVCSEFILLMHTAGRCLILSAVAVLAGVEIATLCSELSMGERVTRLTVKWCFRGIN